MSEELALFKAYVEGDPVARAAWHDWLMEHGRNAEASAVKRTKVLLAMPRLGDPALECCLAAFNLASSDQLDVVADPRSSSLLAFCFNQCWVNFANDPTFDYFAMLHADQGPSKDWLDVLIREADAGGYGVMHAPAAIKDEKGLTSTAIGHSEKPFGPLRRLTVKELLKLPETFGYEDCVALYGEDERYDCLMPNTGVMLVRRAGFPFDEFPGFCISDRIVRSDEGPYVPLVEPEDWAFGRWCHRNGVRVGGTRKVTTNHFGRANFNTSEAWGRWDRDEQAFRGEAAKAPPATPAES